MFKAKIKKVEGLDKFKTDRKNTKPTSFELAFIKFTVNSPNSPQTQDVN